MTADAAHVAAVAEALRARGAIIEGDVMTRRECARAATVAVETLTPLIRAQALADALAAIAQEREEESVPLTAAGLDFAADAVRVLLNAARIAEGE